MRALVLFFALAAPLAAQAIELRMDSQESAQSLTTDQVIQNNEQAENAHLRVWSLARATEPMGWQAYARGLFFGVRLAQIKAVSIGALRELPMLAGLKPPCAPASWGDRWKTTKGAQAALLYARTQWEKEIRSSVSRLEKVLTIINAESEETALKAGALVWEKWMDEREQEFMRRIIPEALNREKAINALVARDCSRAAPPSWSRFMEAPSPEAKINLVARAPAKRWPGGYFTFRVSLEQGEAWLNGQFRFEPGVPGSLLNPVWLDFQGTSEVGMSNGLDDALTLPWTRFFNPGGELAYRARTQLLEVSGIRVARQGFYVLETEFSEPPGARAFCCDGLLGADFLRNKVVELRDVTPFEALIYETQGFSAGTTSEARVIPIEAHYGPDSVPSLTCQWGGVGPDLRVILDPALPEAWAGTAKIPKGKELVCSGVSILAPEVAVQAGPPQKPRPGYARADLIFGAPLTVRGRVTWDLPHGRIWVPRLYGEAPILANRTGLGLKFIHEEGHELDRDLKVFKLDASRLPDLKELQGDGLRVGSRITSLGGVPTSHLDDFRVEQLLAGAEATEVWIEWEGPKKSVKKGRLRLKK